MKCEKLGDHALQALDVGDQRKLVNHARPTQHRLILRQLLLGVECKHVGVHSPS